MFPRLAIVCLVAACSSRAPASASATAPASPAATADPAAAGPADADAGATPIAPATATASGPFFIANPTVRAVPIRRADAPNYRYANLDRSSCEAELGRRALPIVIGEPTEGVLAPVRLRGPLHGITIHTERPPKEREHSIYEIFDCRLVLALDDFTEVLASRDVVEIIHFNAYRPKSQYGCTAKYWGLQHCAALAIDVRELRRKDGSTLNVNRDFHGHIGLGTCAAGVGPSPATPAAVELWSILCDAASRALFNVMLTPNYNTEHKNHFHLEVTPQAGWMMVK